MRVRIPYGDRKVVASSMAERIREVCIGKWASLEWPLTLEVRDRRFKSFFPDQFCSSTHSLVVLNVGLINQRSEFDSQCVYQVRGRFV